MASSTLTLPLSIEQKNQLDQLKKYFNEATGTKAIHRAINSVLIHLPRYREQIKKLENENEKFRLMLYNLLQNIDEVENAKKELSEQIFVTRSELSK